MRSRESRAQIFAEITRESREVRQEYVRSFFEEAKQFANVMGDVMSEWLSAYESPRLDAAKKKVLALAYAAISLHVSSMKLFLAGQQVASGNVMRQALEAIAVTFLCSEKDLGVLDRFDSDEYSTKNAIRDLRTHCRRVRVKKSALGALEHAQKFYSTFSHPSKLTLGTLESFAGEGIYVGAAYDPGKLKYYRSEIANRIRLAKVFPSFLQVVLRNLNAW